MKTAISVSDDIFELSEKLAKKLKVSRSRIFAMGVAKLAAEYDEDELVAQINKVCEKVDTSIEPFWKEKQSRVAAKEKW